MLEELTTKFVMNSGCYSTFYPIAEIAAEEEVSPGQDLDSSIQSQSQSQGKSQGTSLPGGPMNAS